MELRPQRTQLPLQHGIMLLHSMHSQLQILSIPIDKDDLLLKLLGLILRLSKRPLRLQSYIIPSPLHGSTLLQLRYNLFTHIQELQPLRLQFFELISASLNVFSQFDDCFGEINVSSL